MKKLTIYLLLFLTCCSNTSNLYNNNSKQQIDFSHYGKAIIFDLKDDSSRTKKRQKVLLKGKLYSDMLAIILEEGKIFSEVERNSETNKTLSKLASVRELEEESEQRTPKYIKVPENSSEKALLIKGKITKLQEGNRVARSIIGIGKTACIFEAEIEFIDNQSQKVIAKIDINERTSPLGGIFASLEDLDSIIEASAEITVDELLKTYKNNSEK